VTAPGSMMGRRPEAITTCSPTQRCLDRQGKQQKNEGSAVSTARWRAVDWLLSGRRGGLRRSAWGGHIRQLNSHSIGGPSVARIRSSGD
jgi:hypothetical protein